jgi:ketosteroid isomerase-like protein
VTIGVERRLSIMRLALLAFAFALIVAAQTPSEPTVQLPPELDRILREFEKGWTGRDAKGLANLFTEDGYSLPPGSPMVRGRSALEKHYSMAGGPLTLRAVAYSTDGNTGYIVGAYRSNPDGPDAGKFVLALRKDKLGRWQIAADIDNPNARPKPPAPPPPPSAP